MITNQGDGTTTTGDAVLASPDTTGTASSSIDDPMNPTPGNDIDDGLDDVSATVDTPEGRARILIAIATRILKSNENTIERRWIRKGLPGHGGEISEYLRVVLRKFEQAGWIWRVEKHIVVRNRDALTTVTGWDYRAVPPVKEWSA